MERIESVHFSAALAITGTWRGTSRQKFYAELGWESLNSRRWSRRLSLFYKIVNNFTPSNIMDPVPQLHQFNSVQFLNFKIPLQFNFTNITLN